MSKQPIIKQLKLAPEKSKMSKMSAVMPKFGIQKNKKSKTIRKGLKKYIKMTAKPEAINEEVMDVDEGSISTQQEVGESTDKEGVNEVKHIKENEDEKNDSKEDKEMECLPKQEEGLEQKEESILQKEEGLPQKEEGVPQKEEGLPQEIEKDEKKDNKEADDKQDKKTEELPQKVEEKNVEAKIELKGTLSVMFETSPEGKLTGATIRGSGEKFEEFLMNLKEEHAVDICEEKEKKPEVEEKDTEEEKGEKKEEDKVEKDKEEKHVDKEKEGESSSV